MTIKGSVVDPYHLDADADRKKLIRIRIGKNLYGSASEKTDPDTDPRIRIGKKRIRIQLSVKDFCEFYFSCYVFPSLYFRFLKKLLYSINLIKIAKKKTHFLSSLFWLLFMLPGSVFSVTMRIRIRIHNTG